MFYIVDYWKGGYNEEERFGIYDDTKNTFYYSKYNVVKSYVDENKIMNGQVALDRAREDNILENPFIERIVSVRINNSVRKSILSKIPYQGITLNLKKPMIFKSCISGNSFRYKDICFEFLKNRISPTRFNGSYFSIILPNWKDSTLDSLKEILDILPNNVEIIYPNKANQGKYTLNLTKLTNLLNTNKQYILTSNLSASNTTLKYINLGSLDFNNLFTFHGLYGRSSNVKFLDFSNCVNDIQVCNRCIGVSGVEESLKELLYPINFVGQNNVFIVVREDMQEFIRFLTMDRRVKYLGILNNKEDLEKNIAKLFALTTLIKGNNINNIGGIAYIVVVKC